MYVRSCVFVCVYVCVCLCMCVYCVFVCVCVRVCVIYSIHTYTYVPMRVYYVGYIHMLFKRSQV